MARPQAAAAAEREAWLHGKVEASVFAGWLQDVEDGCLDTFSVYILGKNVDFHSSIFGRFFNYLALDFRIQ